KKLEAQAALIREVFLESHVKDDAGDGVPARYKSDRLPTISKLGVSLSRLPLVNYAATDSLVSISSINLPFLMLL
ncbi:hypothetical protein ACEYW6_28090, partial [Nostoc sp. UIC 10607]|uniref:hypothetical protein n=1 Tax=Nostoc sp. UIC 10607 TaxID=3045935 RepID=UPI0039A25B9E